MNDDSSHFMTPFDEYISNPSLQMTKLLIPFLPSRSQRMMAVYVKFMELHHTFSFFRSMNQKANSAEDILNSMKPYMSSSEAESFDQMLNAMSMMTMMQEMQNIQGENFDPTAMVAGMFAQDTDTKPQKEGETLD